MASGLLRCTRKDGVVSKQVRANGLWYEGSAAPGVCGRGGPRPPCRRGTPASGDQRCSLFEMVGDEVIESHTALVLVAFHFLAD